MPALKELTVSVKKTRQEPNGYNIKQNICPIRGVKMCYEFQEG